MSTSSDGGKTFTDTKISDCKKRSTLEYKEGGVYISTPYAISEESCIVDGAEKGAWQKLGNEYAVGKASNSLTTIDLKINDNSFYFDSNRQKDLITRFTYKRVN